MPARIGDRQTGPGCAEGIPAALVRRLARGAAGDQRGPVHRGVVDVDADLLEHRSRHLRDLLQCRLVGRRHQQHRFALVAALADQPLGLFYVARAGERVHAGHVGHGAADGEEACRQLAEIGLFADDRGEKLALVDRRQDGAQQLAIVERRVKEIRPDNAKPAKRIVDRDGRRRSSSSASAPGRSAAHAPNRPRRSAAPPQRSRHRA